jgi:hypothetical protein
MSGKRRNLRSSETIVGSTLTNTCESAQMRTLRKVRDALRPGGHLVADRIYP